jgi:hypothetical protein
VIALSIARPLLLSAVLMASTAGCGLFSDDTAAATWTLAPDQAIDADTVSFTALVQRLGCNSGINGEVLDPEVTWEADQVVLTFMVSPGESSEVETCEGTMPVEYDVTLERPLGDRRMMDGECLPGGEAETTTWCSTGGIRFPAAPEPAP